MVIINISAEKWQRCKINEAPWWKVTLRNLERGISKCISPLSSARRLSNSIGTAMENELRKYPIDKLSDVIDYIKQGYHSFIGCDDTCKRNQFVESLQVALDGSIQEQISCGDVLEPSEFAARIIVACRNFMAAVGVSSLQRRLSIANSLDEVMEIYGLRNRQGFLILSDVDKLVGLQRAYEIEGSLRSAMQLRDNVAVVIVASNGVIDGLVGDYDRPFYSSFRVFRL